MHLDRMFVRERMWESARDTFPGTPDGLCQTQRSSRDDTSVVPSDLTSSQRLQQKPLSLASNLAVKRLGSHQPSGWMSCVVWCLRCHVSCVVSVWCVCECVVTPESSYSNCQISSLSGGSTNLYLLKARFTKSPKTPSAKDLSPALFNVGR